MKKLAPGALAGLAAAVLLAAPAPAAPGNVTVRIEGAERTLVPRTLVRTTDQPAVDDPNTDRFCKGTSAMGPISQVTGGNFAGEWQSSGYVLQTIMGERHWDPTGDPSRYWSFWVNYRHMNVGLCDPEYSLQEGDDVIIVVDCFSMTNACQPAVPLRLGNVPPTVAPGQAVTVKVEEFDVKFNPDYSSTTTPKPAAGATVAAGGQMTTTGTDGTATLTFPSPGPVTISVTKADRVRTAGVTCVTSGNDGNCGTQLPPGTPLGTEKPDDTTAPEPRLSRIQDGATFSRRRAPRELQGTVSADPSGIKSVRLSIHRRHKGRCWAFDGDAERFKRHRCGGSRSFRIGDRAEWSYLLPRRLPVGRYAIRVAAIDKAGNASAATTKLRVR